MTGLRLGVGVPLPSDGGLRSVIAAFFTGLADHADGIAGPGAVRLADTVASLLITTFLDTTAERAELSTGLADRILSYTLASLADPGLSAASVARRHGISPRYLHKLMRDRGIQFGAWVRHERMKRIRQDLLDPRLANWTVAAIAARWGIPDADHLSRSLRAEFGSSAAEIRARAGALRVEISPHATVYPALTGCYSNSAIFDERPKASECSLYR